MKKFITLLMLLTNLVAFSQIKIQKKDSILTITTKIYKSYFKNENKSPFLVEYNLYKGGGDFKRDGIYFRDTVCKINNYFFETTNARDYNNTRYDKGHCANAEDFANNYNNLKHTFYYFNMIPQSHNLNAGIWKTDEELARKYSQTDSIFIQCGGIYSNNFVLSKVGNKLLVPDYCYKIVRFKKSGTLIFCRIYTNMLCKTGKKCNSYKNVSIAYIEEKIKYKLK